MKRHLLYYLNRGFLQPLLGLALLPTNDVDALVASALRTNNQLKEAENAIERLLRQRLEMSGEQEIEQRVMH